MYFGVHFIASHESLQISQQSYIKHAHLEFGLINVRFYTTLMASNFCKKSAFHLESHFCKIRT